MTLPRAVKLVIRQWLGGGWAKRSTVSTDPLQSVDWIGAVGVDKPPAVGGDGMGPHDFYEQRATT